jgi:hypothetical protein
VRRGGVKGVVRDRRASVKQVDANAFGLWAWFGVCSGRTLSEVGTAGGKGRREREEGLSCRSLRDETGREE